VESRLALAMALSLGILVGFQVLFPQQKPEQATTAEVPAQVAAAPAHPIDAAPAVDPKLSAPGADAAPPAAPAAAAAPQPGTPIDIRTSLFRVSVQPLGGRLTSFELSRYRREPGENSGPYDLIRAATPAAAPLAVFWRTEAGAVDDDRAVSYEVTVSPAEPRPGEPSVVTMRGRTPSGATITKVLTIPFDSYFLDYKVATEGLPATPLAAGWSRELNPNKSSSDLEGGVGYFEGTLHPFDAITLEETEVVEGKASWAGYAEHYFLAAYVPKERTPLKLVTYASGGYGHAALWTPTPATGFEYGLYVGPKSFDELEKAGHDLVQAVDLGWFWFVAKPLLVALLWIERVVGNYGWAIVLLTVAVRLAFYPVNKKQIEAMKGMQRISPEIKKLQERYANDREKMNVEMMELYRRHKVNPLAGCLPMLVQLPVFIGLYNVLLQSIELRHAPFFGWMHDLSQPDRLGSLAIPFVEPAGIPVMTLLMGATMVIQQKMTPSTMDPQQQRIMMIMPVVFTVMFVNFPAGLVLYWLSNNVLSIGQQWLSDRQA
jgi:YidC/Oxa1 family membrane protein insertase